MRGSACEIAKSRRSGSDRRSVEVIQGHDWKTMQEDHVGGHHAREELEHEHEEQSNENTGLMPALSLVHLPMSCTQGTAIHKQFTIALGKLAVCGHGQLNPS